MASTQISDVIVPEVYETYMAENLPEKTAFFDSGVVVRNGMLDGNATEGLTYLMIRLAAQHLTNLEQANRLHVLLI
jgi:hypothetical protein